MIPEPVSPAPASAAAPVSGLAIALRRGLFAGLVGTTMLGALVLFVRTLSAGGFGWLDVLLTLCFAVTLPWITIGLWNALIGLVLLRLSPDPARIACPTLVEAAACSAIQSRTALLSCIRNEDAEAVARNLDRMIAGLVESGAAERFEIYVLSDSHWPECIAGEEKHFGALAERWAGRMPVTYRRRPDNPAFKAGNIADFCERWGDRHDFMLVFDADSLMAPELILRMVRTLEQDPRIGILQSVPVGLPSASAFARPLQFGMRLVMTSFTLGNAWWQADAGPYWGHNALIRVQPFKAHCGLPRLPGRGPLSGWLLSHDQVEAALMRRAGYEVRVLATDSGSWEETPTTLTEYIRRDLRWCQGNLQYLKLLGLPGLHPLSRVNLIVAMLGFISSPAWIALMLAGALRPAFESGPIYEPAPGLMLFALILTMAFAPKLATLVDLFLREAGRQRFGGGLRLAVGAFSELLFSVLISPILAIAHTVFIAGLFFGRAAVWGAQRRAVHWVRPQAALRRLWPQTLLGAAAVGWYGAWGSATAALFSPFYVSALLAVPIAVLTSLPRLGLTLARIGLWRTPDEVAPAPVVQALYLPALAVPPPRRRLGEAAAEPIE